MSRIVRATGTVPTCTAAGSGAAPRWRQHEHGSSGPAWRKEQAALPRQRGREGKKEEDVGGWDGYSVSDSSNKTACGLRCGPGL
jgi:hypothetical protein